MHSCIKTILESGIIIRGRSLNHAFNACIIDMSFNPYFGTHKTTNNDSFICKDNPGFAPVWEQRGSVDDSNIHPGPYGESFARVTWEYIPSTHDGIDFRGASPAISNGVNIPGREIKSSIYGKVINYGWNRTDYGRIMVIADIKRNKGIYLLAHLSDFAENIKRGSIVQPNDTVAYVGRSGSNRNNSQFSPHLHLEYFDVEYSVTSDTPDDNPYVRKDSDNYLVLQTQLTKYGEKRRDPFVHSRP